MTSSNLSPFFLILKTSMSLFAAIVVLTTFSPSSSTPINACSSKPETSKSHCPPFSSSSLSFPFSSSPGCGHPAFQVKCSTPHSTISINDLSFSLLSFDLNSSSLLLSPNQSDDPETCSSLRFLSIPSRPINLTGSPFRVSEAYCSRLAVLRSCSPPVLPNCSLCPWHCKLAKSPVDLLLHGCGSVHRHASEQEGCQEDVLEYLEELIGIGIKFEWDEVKDDYFTNCTDCRTENGVCGFNSSDPGKQFLCFRSQARFSPPWMSVDSPRRIAVLCSVFALACALLFALIGFSVFRSGRFRSSVAGEDPTTLFLHRHRSASLLPPVFTYEEMEDSTNRFDPKRKIGDGGFGSVYLGQLRDGRIVAVKYLHKQNQHGHAFTSKSFCNEILILSSIDHPNLVKLHGYCSDPRGLLLVYDYVPNGTLADHLHGPKSQHRRGSLTWQVRVDIALQIAMAMEYLHFSVVPPVVHRDITSSNIFVERDMRIKVGDFGLSRLLAPPENASTATSRSGCVWTGPQGTPGYLDPDYHRSFRLTEKSDVYSFGVVLLELISGMKAVDQSRDKREMSLADLVVSKIHMGLLHQVVDQALTSDDGGRDAVEGVSSVAELAFRCVAADKDDRPDAREVVEELRLIRSRTRGVEAGPALIGVSITSVEGL